MDICAPRLHLEYAHAVRPLQHGVSVRVFGRYVRHRRRAMVRGGGLHQGERLADGRQHAEAEHVHLEQAKGFEVVLVPLNDGALGHGGVLHRHEFRERPGGDDETADMLGEMPRKTEYLFHQVQKLLGDPGCLDSSRRH